jgi:PAS domain S-box-containing protein
VIAASPIPILEVGLDDRVRLWNPAAERVFGWSAEEVVGQVVPFVPPDARSEFVELVARVRSGTTYTGFEAVRLRKDGSRIDVEISAAPIRDRGGTVSGHMVAFVDVTERKRQDAELKRLNAELRAGLDELRASRARIVEAADAERRRLERNLHDGAQQRLVTLALDLRLARGRVGHDPDDACRLLDAAAAQLAEGLAELRELARGIHPAVLSERGLGRRSRCLRTVRRSRSTSSPTSAVASRRRSRRRRTTSFPRRSRMWRSTLRRPQCRCGSRAWTEPQ